MLLSAANGAWAWLLSLVRRIVKIWLRLTTGTSELERLILAASRDDAGAPPSDAAEKALLAGSDAADVTSLRFARLVYDVECLFSQSSQLAAMRDELLSIPGTDTKS
jgi:hypothetical protein